MSLKLTINISEKKKQFSPNPEKAQEKPNQQYYWNEN